jgi:internalin A
MQDWSGTAEESIARALNEGTTSVDLSSFSLAALPESLRSLSGLSTLDLSGNKLRVLPDWLGELGELTKLDVSGNGLEALPESLGALTQLNTLHLSRNRLQTLPALISSLTGLNTLQLIDSGLTALPESLRSLTELTTLYLGDNALGVLPDWLGELHKLTNLYLGSNGLEALPPSLSGLTSLMTLNLSRNRLQTLPDWLGALTALQVLDVSDNKLGALHESLGGLANLRVLDASGNRLESLPQSLSGLTNLTTLHLSRNRLQALPDWLGELTSLTDLGLGDNGLVTLPESFANLVGLTTLGLDGNWLETMPGSLRPLTKLSTLNLSGNRLQTLPDWLPELTTLNIGDNWLVTLPESVRSLTDLSTLHLSRNRLQTLPDWLDEMTSLTTLNLSDNRLQTLPDALAGLPDLTNVYLHGNPLISPPPEIVAGGTQSVLAFLRAGRNAGTKRLWRSKLLLVGQGRAGKTTLVAALEGRKFDPLQKSTEGLSISDLMLPHPNPDGDPDLDGIEMDLSVWDFGGQEIYHATHQFFLTARSLFLVVWDPNTGYDNSRLQYWLNTVTARAPDAPILLVATHGAQRPADLPLADLRRRFPAIVGAFTVDSATGDQIDELRETIAAHAANLPLMGAPWPAHWAAGADAIRALPGSHTTADAVHTLLDSHAVTGADQDELLSALSILGDILHYPDDSRLADTIVLQPQWLNTRIARILDSKPVAARGGQLLWDDVSMQWADIDPAMREHFLTMMDRYDISYRVHDLDAATASLVIALLPWERPDLSTHWPQSYTGRQTGLSYQLSFIPPGIPTWFITRTRRFTVEHWRTGALLRDPDTGSQALIEADPDTGALHLAARGADLERFLPVLLAELAHSLARYPGLSAKRFVDCPHPDGDQHTPHQYNYMHLLKMLLRDDVTVTCPETGTDFEIAPLLAGINPTPAELADLSRSAEILHLEAKLGVRFDELEAGIQATRQDTAVLRVAAAEAVGVRCPSVFTVRAVRRGPMRVRYQLRVCCQSEDGPHEVQGKDAAYDLHALRAWARTIAPGVQAIAASAKAAAPLISLLLAGVALELHGNAKKEVVNARTHLASIPNHLSLIDQPSGTEAIHEVTEPTSFAHTEADYRQIQGLFQALDTQRTNRRPWGGLSAAQDTKGHTIYLCPQHAPRHDAAPDTAHEAL